MIQRLSRRLKRLYRRLLRRKPTLYEIYYGDDE